MKKTNELGQRVSFSALSNVGGYGNGGSGQFGLSCQSLCNPEAVGKPSPQACMPFAKPPNPQTIYMSLFFFLLKT
jgi:hypothetical protein